MLATCRLRRSPPIPVEVAVGFALIRGCCWRFCCCGSCGVGTIYGIKVELPKGANMAMGGGYWYGKMWGTIGIYYYGYC